LRRFWFPLSLFTMLVFGGYDILRGVAAPLMRADWHLSYGQLGTAFAVGSFGYLIGTFLTGFVIERFGLKPVMAIGAAIMVLGTVGIIQSHTYLWAVASFLVNGLGGGVLEIGVNAVVPGISQSASDQSRYFNWLHGFYGIGACGFPLLVAWLIRLTGSWRFVYLLLLVAVMAVLASSLLARTRNSRATTDVTSRSDAPGGLWREKALYGLLVAIMAYVMAEVGLGTWLTTYLLQARGVSLAVSSLCLSGFYLTFTIGRLSAPLWLNRLGHERSVLAGLVLSMLALAVAWLPGSLPLVGFWVAGVGFSIIFPTITAIASHTFAANSGKVLGVLFTAAGIGSLATNGLIGGIATLWGVAAGFSLIWIYLLVVLASMLFVMMVNRSSRIAGSASATPTTEGGLPSR
jgi:fucose permease